MFWIIQVVIVSIVIIFLLHNLYIFFKETLTVPKMKDMVKRPQQKYESLFRELEELKRDHVNMNSGNGSNANGSNMNGSNVNGSNGSNGSNANGSNDAMKNELKRYIMEMNSPQSNADLLEIGSVYQ